MIRGTPGSRSEARCSAAEKPRRAGLSTETRLGSRGFGDSGGFERSRRPFREEASGRRYPFGFVAEANDDSERGGDVWITSLLGAVEENRGRGEVCLRHPRCRGSRTKEAVSLESLSGVYVLAQAVYCSAWATVLRAARHVWPLHKVRCISA